jgi:hypothetical protein
VLGAAARTLYEECTYIIIKLREENVVPQTWAHGDGGIADLIMNSVFGWRTWLFNYLYRVSDLYGRPSPACLYYNSTAVLFAS